MDTHEASIRTLLLHQVEEKFTQMENMIKTKDELIEKLETERGELMKTHSLKGNIVRVEVESEIQRLRSGSVSIQEEMMAEKQELQGKLVSLQEESDERAGRIQVLTVKLKESEEAYGKLEGKISGEENRHNELKIELIKVEGQLAIAKEKNEINEKQKAVFKKCISKLEKTCEEKSALEDLLKEKAQGYIEELEKKKKAFEELKVKYNNMKNRTNNTEKEWKEKTKELENEVKELQSKLLEAYTKEAREKEKREAAESNATELQKKVQSLKIECENQLKTIKNSKTYIDNTLQSIRTELETKSKECANLQREINNYKLKEEALERNLKEKYELNIEEPLSVDTMYVKYKELGKTLESYIKKYEEEKENSRRLQEKLDSLLRDVEKKVPLISAQSKAYESLVITYKETLDLLNKKSKQLVLAEEALNDKALKFVNEKQVDKNLIEKEQKLNAVKEENSMLKAKLRDVIEATRRNEQTLKEQYDAQLAKKEAHNKEFSDSLGSLISSIKSSEHSFKKFLMHSEGLVSGMSKIREDNTREQGDTTNAVSKLESENSKLQINLAFKEQQINLMTKEALLWQEKANNNSNIIEELRRELNEIQDNHRKNLDTAIQKENAKSNESYTKLQTELTKLQEEYRQCKVELDARLEGEFKYKEQNQNLRTELQKITEAFIKLKDRLIEISTAQYNLVKEAILGKQNIEEDLALLKIRNKSLQETNENLTKSMTEVIAKLKELQLESERQGRAVVVNIISAREENKVQIPRDHILKLQRLSQGLNVTEVNKTEEYESEINRLREILLTQQMEYNSIISMNEETIKELQQQFYLFSESASKEVNSLREQWEETKNEKTREQERSQAEIEALKSEVEKLKREATVSAVNIGQIREQLEHRVRAQSEQDKKLEEVKKQADGERRKFEENLRERQSELERVYEFNNVIEQLKLEVETKTQNYFTIERQLKVQGELYEKNKSELEGQINQYREREDLPNERLKALEATHPETKELIASVVEKNESLEFNLNRLRADIIAVREELAKSLLANDKLNGEYFALLQAFEVYIPLNY